MKRIYRLVSIVMLVTLMSIQLVQAAHHHHDDVNHFTKYPHSSSQEDFQLASPKCFICTFHSNQNLSAAIVPAVFELVHYTTTSLQLQAECHCAVNSNYHRKSYNKGPPFPVTLSF